MIKLAIFDKKTCIVEPNENKLNFTAKIFDKKMLMDPQNAQQKVILIEYLMSLNHISSVL